MICLKALFEKLQPDKKEVETDGDSSGLSTIRQMIFYQDYEPVEFQQTLHQQLLPSFS
jgi:hypothetical protein